MLYLIEALVIVSGILIYLDVANTKGRYLLAPVRWVKNMLGILAAFREETNNLTAEEEKELNNNVFNEPLGI